MRRVAATVGMFGVLLSVAYLAVCWHVVHSMITMDREPSGLSPTELGVLDVEELSFRAPDGIGLIGWFVPATGDRVVVLVHGIYSNAWDGQAPEVARAYHEAGL